MIVRGGVLLLLLVATLSSSDAFSVRAPMLLQSLTHCPTSTALWMGKKRRARQTQKVETSSPANSFANPDLVVPTKGKKKKKKKTKKLYDDDDDDDKEDVPMATAVATDAEFKGRDGEFERARQALEQKEKLEAEFSNRPSVSTMVYDDDTESDVIVQGQNVLDVITRKAVQLGSSPDIRLAQFFPGVPPDVREQHRTKVQLTSSQPLLDDLVAGYTAAAMVMLPDGSRDIPPHPSVSTHAMDYVLANRDILMSYLPFDKVLGRIHVRALSLEDKVEARRTEKVWKNFLTVENALAAPFRQMVLDAENRVGPNFGNLDVLSYCKGELYERCAAYIALKGMVEHWKKKVVDAQVIDTTEVTTENWMTVLNTGDPRRFLPNSPVYSNLNDCTRIYDMSQKMLTAFLEQESLVSDLPVELRFLEAADKVKGGTLLRKFVVEDFCPKEGIDPAGLREGLRRLQVQVLSLQIDPYGELHDTMTNILEALSVGTDEGEVDPYFEFASDLRPDAPGFFQTYTFNHDPLSHVRFLDNEYEGAQQENLLDIGDIMNMGGSGADVSDLFKFNDLRSNKEEAEPELRGPEDDFSVLPKEVVPSDEPEVYNVPEERAIGRPHELGWLKLLDDDPFDESTKFGKVPPGKIIMDP